MIKKIILINLIIIFTLNLSLELIFNFFKLSGLMGIQRGLIYNKGDTFRYHMIFDMKVTQDLWDHLIL